MAVCIWPAKTLCISKPTYGIFLIFLITSIAVLIREMSIILNNSPFSNLLKIIITQNHHDFANNAVYFFERIIRNSNQPIAIVSCALFALRQLKTLNNIAQNDEYTPREKNDFKIPHTEHFKHH